MHSIITDSIPLTPTIDLQTNRYRFEHLEIVNLSYAIETGSYLRACSHARSVLSTLEKEKREKKKKKAL